MAEHPSAAASAAASAVHALFAAVASTAAREAVLVFAARRVAVVRVVVAEVEMSHDRCLLDVYLTYFRYI
jgi:hypothetical protein